MASKVIVEIDGSVLEGGGQILRNAVAFSCLLGKPVRVKNIRASRSNPGLRPQHLSGINLVAELCKGKVEGGNVGSSEITFYPSKLSGGSYVADTKTAGSICLLIQVALPCLLFADCASQLLLKGGTNADMAPQVDYTLMVLKPIAERFGVKFECDIKRRGFYPKGGGEVLLTAQPVKQLSPVDLTVSGDVVRIFGRSFVAGHLPKKIAHIMAGEAQAVIQHQCGDVPYDVEIVKEPEHTAVGTGTGIIIVAQTSTGCLLAGSGLGKKGIRAEKVGQDAGKMLQNNLELSPCADEYLQDQLIILMALAAGRSKVKTGPLTLHTKTAIHIAELLTDAKFTVTPEENGCSIIECEGMGLQNDLVK